ncbi:MAG: pyridoxal-dependent decarboxylase [Nostoc sp. DedQUE05]|uniref:pyridoxal-dependent decarboxylase n=1 Tax=Nostoc sp. DedQUE05 TaxID=3075391 RepID=UPI002AD3AFE1|nr:pyridoxal-dependent decarboxylase [Nostoc sp. DedQUE05]MDZ8092212.1 pyridoxal-dependent decarboxylase [Nostoc sp. DedQUE05]
MNLLAGGVIQDSANSTSLVALIAAKKQLKADINQLVVYTSTQAHFSIEKAAIVAGIKRENFHLIKVDADYRMCPELLQQQIVTDIKFGLIPFYIAATVGILTYSSQKSISRTSKLFLPLSLWGFIF